MNAKEEEFKPSLLGAGGDGKRERAFELSLPAVVTGLDQAGNRFREKTLLISISSEEATIWLRAKVALGSKLEVSLEIPKTLILENHLKLQLSGSVAAVQTEVGQNGKKRIVSLRLDRRFKLLAVPLNIN